MQFKKPTLSFWQIINMNVGFFGIQYSFGLQQSAVNPIYDFLGADPSSIPILNLAGPLTGLIVQPIIGAISDKTFHPKWGRRKPFFLIGAILCSIALFFFPFSSSLWFATGMLWILDIGNNTAMEPYRAFVADTLDDEQQGQGFLTQSFFTGLGQTLANLSLFIFPLFIFGKTGSIPHWVFASFFLGAVCSIASIWWSIRKTPDVPLSEAEINKIRSGPRNILTPFIDIASAIKNMPRSMWILALVYLFQWYALFCYWQNCSKSIAQNSFGWTHNRDASDATLFKSYDSKLIDYCRSNYINKDSLELIVRDQTAILNLIGDTSFSSDQIRTISTFLSNQKKYESAVSWTGLVNGWYNIVTFLVAFFLIFLAKRFGAKWVHMVCLLIAGIGFIAFSYIENRYLLFPAITGFGIAWASMMGVPYVMVMHEIPQERNGVYMGIINMLIVIPMFIQTISFGYIMRNLLDNDSSNAILFAGILLLIASCICILMPVKQKVMDDKSKSY